MVAFKEEFPYLRAESGQLFEFDRAWLRDEITSAAKAAGYPGWWLTEHVTESIAFYLRLRTDEGFVAFGQLSQTVRYVLRVIGYKEIVPHFSPAPPPVTISLFEIAHEAGAGYELAFFEMLTRQLELLLQTRVHALNFRDLNAAVKHLRGVRVWTRACDVLRSEIVLFIRERIFAAELAEALSCSIR